MLPTEGVNYRIGLARCRRLEAGTATQTRPARPVPAGRRADKNTGKSVRMPRARHAPHNLHKRDSLNPENNHVEWAESKFHAGEVPIETGHAWSSIQSGQVVAVSADVVVGLVRTSPGAAHDQL